MSKNIVEFVLPGKDGLNLSVGLLNLSEPAAMVQIIHGMQEKKEKYYSFMHYLASLNIASIISDIRGHGKSVNYFYIQGYFQSIRQVSADQVLITKYVKNLHPGVKLYIYSHSFGTLIARKYIQTHDFLINGLIMSGTVGYIPVAKVLLNLGERTVRINGQKGYHLWTLFNKGPYNWITGDKDFLEYKILKDPYWSTFKYTNQGLLVICKGDIDLHDYSSFKVHNPKLRILSVTGDEDPFTLGTMGLADTFNALKKVGYTKLTNIVLPHMKHEILNEINRDKVYRIISNFVLSKRGR